MEGPRADRESRLRAASRKASADSSTSGLLNFSTAKSREQSENVYENKGQVQKVAEPWTLRPNADRTSSVAQAWRVCSRYRAKRPGDSAAVSVSGFGNTLDRVDQPGAFV